MNEEQLKAQYEQEMALYDQYQKEMRQQDFPPGADETKYSEEVHPEVSTADRLLAKNFSANEQTTMNFLQTRYPNMDIEQVGGRIYMKNRGEKQFKAFDPQGWGQYVTSPMEAVRDIGDVGYDVAAGIGEGAAAAGGALMALPVSGGALSIPAAMTTGGAAGAGLEVLRQKAGKILGLPQENLDTGNVAISAIGGSVSPLLFGTGALVKNAVKGTSKEALQKSQSGVLKKGYDFASNKAFPVTMEYLGGAPAEATRTLKKNFAKMEELQGNELPFAEDTHAKIINSFKGVEQKLGSEVANSLDSVKQGVNISKVKKGFLQDISNYEKNLPRTASGELTEESAASVKELKNQYNNLFTAKAKQTPEGVTTGVREIDLENPVANAAKSATEELPDVVSAKQAFYLQDQMKDVAKMFKVRPDVGGPSATIADRKGREIGNSAYHEINSALDEATGGLSTKAKKAYADYKNLTTKITPHFKDVDTTFKTLTNADARSRLLLLSRLKEMDDSYGTNVLKEAKILQAHKIYGNPSTEAISGSGSNTGKNLRLKALGGAVGAGMGHATGIPGAEIAGMVAGGGAGAYLGSPAAVKKYVGIQNVLEGKAAKIPLNAKKVNMSVPSVWNMMNERE
jgi:hypothetical protein